MKIVVCYASELLYNSLFSKIAFTVLRSGHKVTAIGLKKSQKKRNIVHKNIKLGHSTFQYFEVCTTAGYGEGMKDIFKVIRYQLDILKILLNLKKEIDAIYAIDLHTGIPAFIFSILFRKPLIFHVADKFTYSANVPRIIKPFFDFLEILIMAKADRIIVASDSRVNDIPRWLRKKVVVIYNSPPKYLLENHSSIDKIHQFDNSNSNQKLLLGYFGNLSAFRFIKELIATVKELDFLELHIGGSGELQDFVYKESKDNPRIIFYGKVPYSKVLNLSSKVDLLIAIYDPSKKINQNSAPNKIYEAMLLGKPIVVAKGTHIDQFVLENDIGFVIDYDKETFKQLMIKLLNDKDKLKIKGRNANKLYETYSWENMEKRLKEILEKIKR